MTRRPLVAGNWKMFHGGATGVTLAAECVKIAAEVPNVDVVISPPFTVLAACAHEADGTRLRISGQNFYPKESGAFTGEISAPMLKESGCAFCVVGHSERRQIFGESDAFVAEKVAVALSAGLIPIACVGETLAEREAGKTLEVVARQVAAFLPTLQEQLKTPIAIAYEPVWAIGTGKNATAAEAEEVHAAIRAQLAKSSPGLSQVTRILYGGSVKPGNAGELIAMPNIDGFLIGGASLDAASFGAIARSADAFAKQSS